MGFLSFPTKNQNCWVFLLVTAAMSNSQGNKKQRKAPEPVGFTSFFVGAALGFISSSCKRSVDVTGNPRRLGRGVTGFHHNHQKKA